MKVEDVMSINPISIGPDEFVTHARELIRHNNIEALPVVEGNRYRGMVTIQDIIKVTSTKSDVTVNGYLRVDVPTVAPKTGLADAARQILNTEEGRLPVLDDGGRLVGVLSIVDVFRGIQELGLPDLPVSKVMTRKVVVCEPDDPVSRVWMNMAEFGIFGFPVVRRRQEVVGMVTRQDVLKRGYVRFERESEFLRKPSSTVKMIMTTPAITVGENDSVRDAARLFVDHDIGRLPVVMDGKLTGIVDRYDVLKVCKKVIAVGQR